MPPRQMTRFHLDIADGEYCAAGLLGEHVVGVCLHRFRQLCASCSRRSFRFVTEVELCLCRSGYAADSPCRRAAFIRR